MSTAGDDADEGRVRGGAARMSTAGDDAVGAPPAAKRWGGAAS
jgi:hypothetical protein